MRVFKALHGNAEPILAPQTEGNSLDSSLVTSLADVQEELRVLTNQLQLDMPLAGNALTSCV